MINSKLIIALLSILLIINCGGSNNKKETIVKGWSPKVYFENAKEEIKKGSYEEAIKLFEELQAIYPSSKYSLQAKLEIAYALLKYEEYDKAIKQLNHYIKIYPNNIATPYAYYLRGVIMQTKSASFLDEYVTDSAQRDIKSVRAALEYYVALIKKFPNNKYSDEAKNKLIILRNILARHELYVARFYSEKKAYLAAINRAKYIIEHYPKTPSIPAALTILERNYEIIGADELADGAKRVLKTNYPNYVPHFDK